MCWALLLATNWRSSGVLDRIVLSTWQQGTTYFERHTSSTYSWRRTHFNAGSVATGFCGASCINCTPFCCCASSLVFPGAPWAHLLELLPIALAWGALKTPKVFSSATLPLLLQRAATVCPSAWLLRVLPARCAFAASAAGGAGVCIGA